jgi:DNA-binding winged helix-turn-helix (wHTH) protein
MMYLFDDYTLHNELYELHYAGVPCPLEPQVLDILLYLIQHRDRVVTREELLEHVWSERFVSEATLDHRVMEARQAIGDSGQRQCRIKTLRGRGYRFVASVEERPAAQPATAPRPQGLAMVHGRGNYCTPYRYQVTAAPDDCRPPGAGSRRPSGCTGRATR